MKTCNLCDRELIHGNQIFCDDLCRGTYYHCLTREEYYNSGLFNAERWCMVGLNSSIEALKEIQEL